MGCDGAARGKDSWFSSPGGRRALCAPTGTVKCTYQKPERFSVESAIYGLATRFLARANRRIAQTAPNREPFIQQTSLEEISDTPLRWCLCLQYRTVQEKRSDSRPTPSRFVPHKDERHATMRAVTPSLTPNKT